VHDLLDSVEDEMAPDGDLFRQAIADSELQHVSEADHLRLAEMLHEAAMGWLAPTLTEYELDDVNKLHALFAGPDADQTLTQLGCSESDIQRLRVAVEDTPRLLDHRECITWLEALPESVGVDMEQLREEKLSGELIAQALDSTRELKDTFGLRTMPQRLQFERLAKEFLGLTPGGANCVGKLPSGADGGIWSAQFLASAAPLYDMHMGVENMGPLLYSIVRFVKPLQVLEVGAGYTSIYIVQALADNAAEMANYGKLQRADKAKCGEVPWLVEDALPRQLDGSPLLHTVDSMAHESTTAHKVVEVAAALGVEQHIQLHEADVWEFTWDESWGQLDMLWVDFSPGDRLDEFLATWWPRLSPGGFVLIHSTVTNQHSRGWLDRLRSQQQPDGGAVNEVFALNPDEFATLSLMEPHKMFQNSTTLIQKRAGGYSEPILTQWP